MKRGLVAVISIVAVCGYGAIAFGTTMTATPTRKPTPTPTRRATATATRKPTATPTKSTKLYVTNDCDSTVTAYPAGSHGNISPLSPVTGLGGPWGVAVDASGNIYVANTGCNSLTVYAAGSNGDTKPIATITGPDTGLNGPIGIAVDSKSKIYVANYGNSNVTEYAPGSNGDAKPIATIGGPDTGLSAPKGIAVDSKGKIYVANVNGPHMGFITGSVTEYAPGSNGDAKPVATISGPGTGLSFPPFPPGSPGQGIAVDSKGEIFATNVFPPPTYCHPRPCPYYYSVTEYAAGSNGDASPVATIGIVEPVGIAVDSMGNFYVANIERVTEYGAGSNYVIATISGPDTGLEYPQGVAVDSMGKIYVANENNSLTEYAAGSNGDAKPVATIGDLDDGLYIPQGIAVDSVGKIYVANCHACGLPGYDSVTEYAVGSNADAKPVATISGPDAGLWEPIGIAVDSKGTIYVANYGGPYGGSVPEYVAGSNGDAKPIANIIGPHTGLYNPQGIAVDSSRKIYVTNNGTTVTEYAPGSNGDAKPIATIAGPDTGLYGTHGIAVDSKGKIYVANGNNSVTEYAPGSNGDTKPIATITGPDTALDNPQDIAVDSKRNIYVVNSNSSVTEYLAGSNGDAKPVATISGWKTGLEGFPFGIAIGP